MRCVYVLMYWSDEDVKVNVPTGEKTPPKLKPYAVFDDAITAEKMKRDGDEIVTVPFFEDPTERALQAIERCKEERPQLVEKPWTVTWTNTDRWGKDSSTLAPPDYNAYPRVTCSNKTVDEHKWTNRVD